MVEYYRQRIDGLFEKLPCNLGNVIGVSFEHCLGIDERYHRFGFRPLFYLEYPADGLLVGGVASYAPYRVCGIKNHSALAKAVDGRRYVLSEICHFLQS